MGRPRREPDRRGTIKILSGRSDGRATAELSSASDN
jgi:hypothetical protein